MLKRYEARGVRFPPAQVRCLIELLAGAANWKAQLHLLQLLPHLAIPAAEADFTFEPLLGFLETLEPIRPRLGKEILPLLEEAARTAPASVRGR